MHVQGFALLGVVAIEDKLQEVRSCMPIDAVYVHIFIGLKLTNAPA